MNPTKSLTLASLYIGHLAAMLPPKIENFVTSPNKYFIHFMKSEYGCFEKQRKSKCFKK